jgi:hypothetical protein
MNPISLPNMRHVHRRALRSAIILTIAAGALAVAAADVVVLDPDEHLRFVLKATHDGDFTSTQTHSLQKGAKWKTEGSIDEASGWDWDTLSIDGFAWHVEPPPDPPHGEGENAKKFHYIFSVDGSVENNDWPPEEQDRELRHLRDIAGHR